LGDVVFSSYQLNHKNPHTHTFIYRYAVTDITAILPIKSVVSLLFAAVHEYVVCMWMCVDVCDHVCVCVCVIVFVCVAVL